MKVRMYLTTIATVLYPVCASLTRLRREPSVSIRKKYPLEPRVSKSQKNRRWAIECKKLWCCNVYCSITLTSACEQANLCEFGENFWRRSRQRKPLAGERSGARKVVLLPRSRFCLVTRQKRLRGRLLLLSCPIYLEKVRLTFSGSVEKISLFDIDSR